MHAAANNLNAVCVGLLLWGSSILMAKEFGPSRPGQPDNGHLLTDIALYASPFAAIVLLGVNHVRLRTIEWRGMVFLARHQPRHPPLSLRTRVRPAAPRSPHAPRVSVRVRQAKVRFMSATDPAVKPEAVAEAMTTVSADRPRPQASFSGEEDVEAVSRLARWTMRSPERDQATVVAAEAVLMAGLRVFPESSALNALHGSFAYDVLADQGVRVRGEWCPRTAVPLLAS